MKVRHAVLIACLTMASSCVVSTDVAYRDHSSSRTGLACQTDAECDDGRACNGIERCGEVSRRCVDGHAVDCTEGLADCAFPSCTEPTGACEPLPSDAACAQGESCDIERGCVRACDEPPLGECDLETQCGCGTGQACYLVDGAAQCAPTGGLDDGELCDPDRLECAPGLTCVPLARGTQSVCRRTCTSNLDCEGVCVSGVTRTGEGVCSQSCTLWGEETCLGDTACQVLATARGQFMTNCGYPTDRGVGAECVSHAECGGRTICVGPDVGECRPLCRDHWECPSGQRCESFLEPVYLDGEEVGPCF